MVATACGQANVGTGEPYPPAASPVPTAVSSVSPGPGGGSPHPSPSPLPSGEHYRVLAEGQNSGYCVEGPQFAIAYTREEWFEISRRQHSCQPLADPAELLVDWEREVGVAAWWQVESCLGYRVRTEDVRREGNAVIVEASRREPDGACAQALGQLESFLAVDRSLLEGATTMRFLLSGKEMGSLPL